MREIRFPICIGGGDIEVDVEVTDEEYDILLENLQLINDINSGENEDDEFPEFADTEDLEDLYQRIINTAQDDAANGALCNPIPGMDDGADFDEAREYIEENYDICPDWPDEDQFEDEE